METAQMQLFQQKQKKQSEARFRIGSEALSVTFCEFAKIDLILIADLAQLAIYWQAPVCIFTSEVNF